MERKDGRKYYILVLAAILIISVAASIFTSVSWAAEEGEEETPPMTAESGIGVTAYSLDDNSGYYEDEARRVPRYTHPLGKNLMNLSIYTESYITEPRIDCGAVSGYDGYGISGSFAAIRLGYNFSDRNNLPANDGRRYSISSDTAQSVGHFSNIGVVGTGAILFQKKYSPESDWEWQTKDGESKKQLHSFSFTDLATLEQYGGGEKYTLYTPSGEDLSRGVYIKISFAYELKYDTTEQYKNIWGITKTRTVTKYVNVLETSKFYLVQNSGKVLFHNATNLGGSDEKDDGGDKTDNGDEKDDGSSALLKPYETIRSGDVTLNGFRLDTLGVSAYEITYRINEGAEQRAEDGQFFVAQGRYDFSVKRKIGGAVRYTIFVDRREVNAAVLGYFGTSLFTDSSQRVYTTGDYPAYVAGTATWNLNATDGFVAPLVGRIYKTDTGKVDDKGNAIDDIVRDIKQPFGADYKTNALQGTIDEPGIYRAEFWGNPRYLDEGALLSGDLYHFVFKFEIVDKDTAKQPSVNQAYLNGMTGFSDMQSKYYSVSLPTAGAGKAIFAFSDFGGAYDFAYKLEREKVTKTNGVYSYRGKTYRAQNDVLEAVDKVAESLVTVRYFDATDPNTYRTTDVSGDVLSKNFSEDIVVFANDSEQTYMRAGLPSLNGRKFRYLSPDSDAYEDGTLYFSFVHVDDFESASVTLTHKDSGRVFDILFDVSVEYQLGLKNAPSGVYTVSERNRFGDAAEYDAVYIAPSDATASATVSIYRNGAFTERTFEKGSTAPETGVSGFILRSVSNALDPYGIVKITKDGTTKIYTYDEVADMWFGDGGVYDFALVDRLGNALEFSIVVSNPVGIADIYLQLEQADDAIQKHFRAFVGETLTLPNPSLSNELFVFDGWLYNDALITDYAFTVDASGALYVWAQMTQVYTYLSFDSDGGTPVERIKAKIGEEIQLPLSVKEGWAFGGWEYGGRVYFGAYTPTLSSPTFKAVWNYVTTSIELYDGNNRETLTAHAGDKVLLPFPERTGYTFFGWREELGDGSIKVYYGQITELKNTESLRLDALWLRENNVDSGALSNGTGSRTALHFVDGKLLESLQASSGSTISLPKPTRAGFTFVGWIRRTSPLSGKIYTSDTLTVPDSDGKIVLEALWIAKTAAAPSVSVGKAVLGAVKDFFNSNGGAIAVGLVGFTLLFYGFALYYIKRQKLETRLSMRDKWLALNSGSLRDSVGSEYIEGEALSESPRAKAVKRYSLLTLVTALVLSVILSVICAFGDWVRLGSFDIVSEELSTGNRAETVDVKLSETDAAGGTFEVETDVYPTKEEVTEKFEQLTNGNENISEELDLTEEEMFLYSLVMIDLYSLGYAVFPAEIILRGNDRVLGFGYSKYEETYKNKNLGEKLFFGAGFVTLPRQPKISEADIASGLEVKHCYDEEELKKDDENSYILSLSENYGPCSYIADARYIVYSVKGSEVIYESVPVGDAVFNADCGSVYDYDEGRIVYDSDLGKKTEIDATSLNTMLDPVIAKSEYSRYIAEQTANGFTVDTLNFVYIDYEAINAYFLSQQDESLLGIDVQEFYDMEQTVGPNEYYTVDASGNLTKLEFPPQKEDKASWLDRLAGAIVSLGMIIAGVVIVAAVNMLTCGALAAATPYIMGAFIGAAVETFMQTVVEGKSLDEVNWIRIGIAAVSGVVSAIPGIGYFTAGLIQGLTEAAFTTADGGSLEDILKSFTVGFVTGVVIHGVGNGIRRLRQCFVAGTGVLMASGGVKAIENIRVGDMVKSLNPYTGKTENKRVLQTFENKTNELVNVYTSDGDVIQATPGHKFYANNSWVSAEDLRAGDILVNVNGQKVIVEKTQHEILDNPVKVYNFEVAENHTYFVGNDTGIAVHNAGCNVGAYRFKVELKGGGEAWYVGKGTPTRNKVSMSQKSHYGKVIKESNEFFPCIDNKSAFIKEAQLMNEEAAKGHKLLNRIASPGFKKGNIKKHVDLENLYRNKWYNGKELK